MDSPFRLLVYGIVAVAIIALVMVIYYNIFAPPTLIEEMKQGLEVANSIEYTGEYYHFTTKTIPENTVVSSGFFDTTNMSIALECTSAPDCCPRGEICSKRIEWDYDYMRFKNDVRADVSVRCVRYDGFPACRFYFVDLPAQAKINSVEILEQDGKNVAVRIEVENSGEQPIAFGQLGVTLYKDIKGEWAETEAVFEPRELDSLDPKKEFRFLWDFDFETGGKYKANFKFEAMNAGFDTVGVEIDVNVLGSSCEIDSAKIPETTSMIDSNGFREIHYCIECDSSFECLSKWNEEYPEFDYELLTKDSVYCIKDTYEGSCG